MAVQVTVTVKNKNVLDKMIRRLPLLPIFVAQQITQYTADSLEASSKEAAPIWRGTLRNSITQKVSKTVTGAQGFIFSDSEYLEDVHEGFKPQPSLVDDPGAIVKLAQWRSDKAKNIPLNRLIHSIATHGIKNPKPFFAAAHQRFSVEQGKFRAMMNPIYTKSNKKTIGAGMSMQTKR